MLSYRHGYHAGGPADVLKHAVWAWLLDHEVRRDPRPLYVLDTHAGAGAYDLRSPMAEKTGEWRQGIGRLDLAAPDLPELFRPWATIVRAEPLYPGSPLLAQRLLRPGDRLELVELHPTDHRQLERGFQGEPEVIVARGDGLAALVQRMPPPERRALVLIDPSYEIKTEYRAVVETLARAWRRMGQGIYLVWYPMLDRAWVEAWLDDLRATRIPRMLRLELVMEPDASRRGMTASGLVVVNPPPSFPAIAEAGLAWLARRLQASGPCRVAWWSAEPAVRA